MAPRLIRRSAGVLAAVLALGACATAQEAALKLREGVHVAAEAYPLEELLHGHLAAVDERVRAFVLEGEGRARPRAAQAVAALEAIGCDVTLLPTRHPVVDVVPFQLLTLDLAEALEVGVATVERVRQRFVEQGLEAALVRKKQARPSRQRALDGRAEAKLIALACSRPPDGRKAWTMRLPADKLVELEVVPSISDEAVRRSLKKAN